MKEKILELRAHGMKYKDIAEEVGCAKSSVAYYCGQGQKAMNAKRQQKKRNIKRRWFDEMKKNLKCKECGEKRSWVLDFHHRDPKTKDGTISQLLRKSNIGAVKEEIKKCDVLCANCHRDLHYQEQKKDH